MSTIATLTTPVYQAESLGDFIVAHLLRFIPLVLFLVVLWFILAWILRKHQTTQNRVFTHMENAEAFMAEQSQREKRIIQLLEKIAREEPSDPADS